MQDIKRILEPDLVTRVTEHVVQLVTIGGGGTEGRKKQRKDYSVESEFCLYPCNIKVSLAELLHIKKTGVSKHIPSLFNISSVLLCI